ncbi:MAG: four helix bundle protein [Planctomycetia bacterium]|nr:four helix bundle protein [Planctomycetia bacterium]
MSQEIRSTNDETAGGERRYDLVERTACFGESTIMLAKQLPTNRVTDQLIDQLVRSATSIGANYCEADDAGSRKEFCYRVSVSKREAREAMHWLRMIAAAVPEMKDQAREQWREAKELHLILAAIHRKVRDDRAARPAHPK